MLDEVLQDKLLYKIKADVGLPLLMPLRVTSKGRPDPMCCVPVQAQ